MKQFIETCIELAKKSGLNAQIFGSTSLSTTYTYKSLTGETLISSNTFSSIRLTLEKDGKKSSVKQAFSSTNSAEALIEK